MVSTETGHVKLATADSQSVKSGKVPTDIWDDLLQASKQGAGIVDSMLNVDGRRSGMAISPVRDFLAVVTEEDLLHVLCLIGEPEGLKLGGSDRERLCKGVDLDLAKEQRASD